MTFPDWPLYCIILLLIILYGLALMDGAGGMLQRLSLVAI